MLSSVRPRLKNRVFRVSIRTPFRRTVALAALFAGAALTVSIADAHPEKTLYDRIGGEKLARMSNEYVDMLATDPRTKRSFAKTDLKRVKLQLNDYLCQLASGPCKYIGDDMREVHAGQNINESEFLSGVQLMRDLLKKEGVPLRERNELLSRLAPVRNDVVQR
jgi:hemoglobin